jgi:predicted O-methyltransferase YrrM
MKLARKILWYLMNLRNLFIACARISLYCLLRPNKISVLFFSFYTSINDFYKNSFGKLYNLEGTSFYKELKQDLLFVRCNTFNMESNVSHLGEIDALATCVAQLKPRIVFEIGTYNGFATLHFAYNTPDNSIIYSLDLPPNYSETLYNEKSKFSYDDLLVAELSKKNVNHRLFKKDPKGKKIIELFGDSSTYDFSPYYRKIDLVYIDGNHSYDFVKSDTENAFKMLSERGVIVWHDFDYIIHRDVFKYLNKLVKTHKIYFIPGTRFAIYGKQLI